MHVFLVNFGFFPRFELFFRDSSSLWSKICFRISLPFFNFFWPFKIRFLLTFRCFHWIFVCFFINIFGYFCIIEYAVEMINYWTIFHLSHFFGKSRSLKFDQLSKDGEKLCKFFKCLAIPNFQHFYFECFRNMAFISAMNCLFALCVKT